MVWEQGSGQKPWFCLCFEQGRGQTEHCFALGLSRVAVKNLGFAYVSSKGAVTHVFCESLAFLRAVGAVRAVAAAREWRLH